jgi:hypothetical protein
MSEMLLSHGVGERPGQPMAVTMHRDMVAPHSAGLGRARIWANVVL